MVRAEKTARTAIDRAGEPVVTARRLAELLEILEAAVARREAERAWAAGHHGAARQGAPRSERPAPTAAG